MTWPILRLDDACELITDGTHHSPPNGPFGDFIYVTAKNIRPWGLDLADITYVSSGTHYEIYGRCPVEHDDVLYIKDGATTGIAVVNHLNQPFSLLSSVALLRPKSGLLDARFLKHWLNSPEARKLMLGDMTGTAIRRLVLRQIRATEIPIPPLPEQRRIVAKLEALLAKVDASRKRLERIPFILKRFRQAVLAAACEGRLTEDWRENRGLPGEWSLREVAELGAVTGGLTKSAKREAFLRKVPYLRVANVYENRLCLDDITSIGITERELEKTRLIKEDLLFVEGNGSLDQIGRVAIWNGAIQDCSHQNHLIRFRAANGILPGYVLYQMMGPKCRAQLIDKATSSAGLHTLSISKISSVELPVPPIEEQAEIMHRIDALFTLSDQIEARYTKAKAQVDRLTQSILAKAFRGELVPQNPNDEPADSLLNKLKAESICPAGRGRGRRRIS